MYFRTWFCLESVSISVVAFAAAPFFGGIVRRMNIDWIRPSNKTNERRDLNVNKEQTNFSISLFQIFTGYFQRKNKDEFKNREILFFHQSHFFSSNTLVHFKYIEEDCQDDEKENSCVMIVNRKRILCGEKRIHSLLYVWQLRMVIMRHHRTLLLNHGMVDDVIKKKNWLQISMFFSSFFRDLQVNDNLFY